VEIEGKGVERIIIKKYRGPKIFKLIEPASRPLPVGPAREAREPRSSSIFFFLPKVAVYCNISDIFSEPSRTDDSYWIQYHISLLSCGTVYST
jgi:hypothetical protein